MMMRRALLALLLASLLAPLAPLLVWSFAHGWRFPSLLPNAGTLAAWRYALSDVSGVLPALGLTVWIAGLVAAIALALALPAARALAHHRFAGRGAMLALVVAPLIVPAFAAALGLHGAMLRVGLTGNVAGVVIVHLIPVLPYTILILMAVFRHYDPSYEAQARSLGARPLQVLAHVTLPTLAPSLRAAALFAFLLSWSQYLPTLLIGGGRVQTLPLMLFSFAASGRNDIAGAIGVIYMVPALVILALTARHITAGAAGRGLVAEPK